VSEREKERKKEREWNRKKEGRMEQEKGRGVLGGGGSAWVHEIR